MRAKPIHFGQDPLLLRQPGRTPFDVNQAISTILFERSSRHFHDAYPNLRMLRHHRLAFFAYPLSGEFERPAVIPTWLVRPVLALERAFGHHESIPRLSHSRRFGKGSFVRGIYLQAAAMKIGDRTASAGVGMPMFIQISFL